MTKIESVEYLLNCDKITIEDIKDVLLKFKSSDILKTILSIYIQYLNNFDIDNFSPNYKLHDNILYVFSYLLENNDKIDYKTLLKKFQKIKTKVDELVIKFKKYNLFEDINKIFISDLNNINSTMETSIMSKIQDSYDYREYEFLDYIINTAKNGQLLKYSLAKYPHYINSKNNENEHIIIKIINNYFDLIINKKTTSDILYYKSIINIFFNNPKFKINNEEQKQISNMINDILNNNELEAKDIFKIREIQGQLFSDSIYNQKNISELNIIYDKSFGFSNDVINCIPNIINKSYNHEIKNDKDEFIVTIDCEDTLDMDDAFSINDLNNGNLLLKVYITDVASKIDYNSFLDIEARKRGSTIYLSDNTILMLPTELSNNLLSLNSNGAKQVIAYIFEITPKGEIVSFKIERDFIKPSKKLNYDFVNRVTKTKIDDNLLAQKLYKFDYLAYVLKNSNMIKNDYRHVEELKKWIDGVPIQGNKYSNRTKAEIIVEEFMLLTGRITSNFCLKNDIPLIYRNHCISEESIINNLDKIKNIKDNNKYSELIKNFISQYPNAYYGLDNKGHTGLGYSSYSHLTSPLRRYCDLMNQRILTDCLLDCNLNKYKQYENNLETIINNLNKTEKINYEYSKEYEKIKSLRR